MRDIGRRVKTIEKKLRPGRESAIRPPIVTVHCGRSATAQDEQKLGPKLGWLTCQQQLQAQEEANVKYLKDHPGCLPKTIVINRDVDEEYQARLSHAAKP